MRHLDLRSKVKPETMANARWLRKNMTTHERVVWKFLKAKGMLGRPFRRQRVLRGWIADFYCPSLGLVVEVDGPSHDWRADLFRDLALQRIGITTLRVTNWDVDNNPGLVVLAIRSVATMLAKASSRPQDQRSAFGG